MSGLGHRTLPRLSSYYYDQFVTWDNTLVQYYKEHPGFFKQTHIVGCLWSEHIQEKNQARKQTVVPALKNLDNRYVIACFDSTYSRNGRTSYVEGLAFAKHLLKLANECRVSPIEWVQFIGHIIATGKKGCVK